MRFAPLLPALLLLASAARAQNQVVVQITAEYEDLFPKVPRDFETRDSQTLPIRRAWLEVIPIPGAASAKQSTYTDDNGHATVTLTSPMPIQSVKVICHAEDETGRVTVSESEEATAPYSFFVTVTPSNGTATVNLMADAPGVPAGASDLGPVFNILDQGIASLELADELEGEEVDVELLAIWSPTESTDSQYNFDSGYLFLQALPWDDSYNDGIILHESFHMLQDQLFHSIAEDVGGGHVFDCTPIRAFPEGCATWWACVVQDSPSLWRLPILEVDAENGVSYFPDTAIAEYLSAFGTDSEIAVLMALWDLVDAHQDENDQAHRTVQEVWDELREMTLDQWTMDQFIQAYDVQGQDFADVMACRVFETQDLPNIIDYPSTDTPLAIPDLGVVTSQLALPAIALGPVSDLGGEWLNQVSFPLAVNVRINHGAFATLKAKLEFGGVERRLFELGQFGPAAEPQDFVTEDRNYFWLNWTTVVEEEIQPWLRTLDWADFFGDQPANGPWTMTVEDTQQDGIAGTLRDWKLRVRGNDWSDSSECAAAWAEDTTYEWLGDIATHETSLNDPFDLDHIGNVIPGGPPEGTDLGDDGLVEILTEGNLLSLTALVNTSGARLSRYLDLDSQPIFIFVTVWIDWDLDGEFEDNPAEKREMLPIAFPPEQGVSREDLRCPVKWMRGVSSRNYKTEAPFFIPWEPGHALPTPVRIRLSCGHQEPLPNGGTVFGEVEDYYMEFEPEDTGSH